jgi:hypothetical protein
MPKKLRMLDYIISLVIFSIVFLFNIVDGGKSIFPAILMSIVMAVVASLIVGTITNFLFKKKND